ncbi:hydrogenase maturation nickel metallochaperone HypA/HybF [Flavihumibacter profundi]|uniref:hydrogenase maturation nickel metallochaperone HypA/HybF n=1 Tax=Flavihumibacter profundi TaxID=2716883 RepID=UPI001CC785D8|nr:hydrogenase maturation nickel metallochaperone HypA [Flavihumibacter profundi]MBZ5859340.1 hydrogenase maturation nickel metallochaperone HypA [Flavihumibacter profundi]
MHELSIVMSIVEIASQQALQANASVVEEIELEIGTLSGIEINALEFAWAEAVRNTILENTLRVINRPEGRARCLDCNTDFAIQQYFDPCPACGSHFINITRGKELKVKSLVIA